MHALRSQGWVYVDMCVCVYVYITRRRRAAKWLLHDPHTPPLNIHTHIHTYTHHREAAAAASSSSSPFSSDPLPGIEILKRCEKNYKEAVTNVGRGLRAFFETHLEKTDVADKDLGGLYSDCTYIYVCV